MVQLANRIMAATLMETQAQHEETVPFLVIIGRVANLLPRQLGIPDICRELTRIIIEETTFDNCSLLLWDAQSGSLALAAAEGLEGLLEGARQPATIATCALGPTRGWLGRLLPASSPSSSRMLHNARSHPKKGL